MTARRIVLIVHNVRSAHNAGSLLRLADGLGVEKVVFSGFTPYPETNRDSRLPHVRQKVARQLHKTALGAERSVRWERQARLSTAVQRLKAEGYQVAALEQSPDAQNLTEFKKTGDVALLVGNELTGLSPGQLKLVELKIQIPMLGAKESFNVATAAAMALYALRWG